ncbi:MAG: DNA cytosine methyltransferase [Candidatus Thermoplasmatota archaeon]|nr:DNA cytosine methyltransferase [Candidatus Thermoplasmatota archaeon]
MYKVLDLFSGMGGFSSGFVHAGFDVTGVDISDQVGMAYEKFTGSKFLKIDLRNEDVIGDFDVVIGGPPCRPWSAVNRSKSRGSKHRDFYLLSRFFHHVLLMRPKIFILENVPLLRNDPEFFAQLQRAAAAGYSVAHRIFRYSDFGAATSRRRLIAVGILDGSGDDFLNDLERIKGNPMDVRSVISDFRYACKSCLPDHVWPNLNTVGRYREKYYYGRFGWRILEWDEPAPSFGNVMKTYILHPDSDLDSGEYRPVSVLEVSRIMGFNHGFSFPEGLGMSIRYQMLVDSVSPVFSSVLSQAVLKFL